MGASEEFQQLKLRFRDPIQHDYEVIRPIVLFAERVSERSRTTEIAYHVVAEKARRFVQEGMLGLQDQRHKRSGRKGHIYPDAVHAESSRLSTSIPHFITAKLYVSLSANMAIARIIIPWHGF